MFQLLQLTDIKAVAEYDGTGFEELAEEEPNEKGGIAVPMLADASARVATFDGSSTDEFGDPVYQFDVLVFKNKVSIKVPYAPKEDWLNTLIENVFSSLHSLRGIDVYDENDNAQYNIAWRNGCPHPLLEIRDIVSMLDDTKQKVISGCNAAKIDARFEGVSEDVSVQVVEKDSGVLYFFHRFGFTAIDSGDPFSLRREISADVWDHIRISVPYQELDNPYKDTGLVQKDHIAPWIYRNGTDAIKLWNTWSGKMFGSEREDSLRKFVQENPTISSLRAIRLTAELLATLDFENYAHPKFTMNHLQIVDETLTEIDIDTSLFLHHGWFNGLRIYQTYSNLFDRIEDDYVFAYDKDVFEEGELIEIKASDYPAVITYRVGEYKPITSLTLSVDQKESSPNNPLIVYGRVIHPVNIRKLEHSDSNKRIDADIEEYFEQLDSIYLKTSHIIEAETVDGS